MEYSLAPPTPAEFRALYVRTGWGRPSEDACRRAIEGSWVVCTARERGGSLVGMGRLISDGVMHAYVNEMIVREDARGHAVGATILRRLVAESRERGVTEIQLFAARGRAPFYLRHGFVRRADAAPGMELPSDR